MAVLRSTFARLVRDTRTMLDITQRDLAVAAGVSRAHIAAVESGRCNPSLDLVQRIADRLGLDLDFAVQAPTVLVALERDLVHAWCQAYVERRLRGLGMIVHREVELVVGRSHGWIDLLAFDPRTGTLFVIEVKTRLDDLGALERQVGWYERDASRLALDRGWRPKRVVTWVVVLASDEVDEAVHLYRDGLRTSFPDRATAMRSVVAGTVPTRTRGLAMIDPASRRRDWLIATRIDGRRTSAPYRGYADAARRRRGERRGERRDPSSAPDTSPR